MTTKTEKAAAAEAAQQNRTNRLTELRERIINDAATGTLKLADGDNIFHKYLPEGVTADHVKQVDGARQEYIADVALVAKEKAISSWVENKDLTQVNGEFPIHNSREKLQTMFSREAGMSLALVTPIVNAKAGDLKEVVAGFQSEIEELFKD